MQEPVVIIGAGPVGLTLALLLHQQGKQVILYEAVETVQALGVGINLLPHSVRVLYGLGLADKLDAIAVRTSSLGYYNKFGQPIWREPRGLDAGYQFPQFSIHRGELQLMLLQEVKERLGENCIQKGHRLIDWQQQEGKVTVEFALSNGDRRKETVACLIAADGINSTARHKLYPDEGDAIYGGRILWRGVTEAKPFLDTRSMFMAGHQDCKFVAYPITRAEGETANVLINWIAELSQPDWSKEDQDWNKEVSINKFAASFADWDFGWVNIPEIIHNCSHVYEFPLADRNPLPQWTHQNMTLIGDAAHPMYPIGSNGASQGILDAEKLAIELQLNGNYHDAFVAYEQERRPATAKIVLLNRQNGPEQVMQMAEERAPNGFDNIHDVISQDELESIAAGYKQTAGFSVDAVNKKS